MAICHINRCLSQRRMQQPRTAAGIAPPKAILQIIRHRFPAECSAAGWFSLEGYHVHDSFLLQALGFLCFFFEMKRIPSPDLNGKNKPFYPILSPWFRQLFQRQDVTSRCMISWIQTLTSCDLDCKPSQVSGDRSHTAGIAGSFLVPTGSVYHHVEEAVFRGRRPRLCKDLVSIRDFGRGILFWNYGAQMCTNNKWAINNG